MNRICAPSPFAATPLDHGRHEVAIAGYDEPGVVHVLEHPLRGGQEKAGPLLPGDPPEKSTVRRRSRKAAIGPGSSAETIPLCTT